MILNEKGAKQITNKKISKDLPRIVIETLIGVYMVDLKQVIKRKGSDAICDQNKKAPQKISCTRMTFSKKILR